MATTLTWNLPCGLMVAGETVREVEIRRMDGTDEDLIHSKKEEHNIIRTIVSRVITRIGTETDPARLQELIDRKMRLDDANAVLLKARMYSIGKTYRFRMHCPKCNKLMTRVIDLSSLVLDEMKEEYRGKEEIVAEVMIDDLEPPEAHVLKYRPMMLGDMEMITAIAKQYKLDKPTRELCVQVKELDGVAPRPESFRQLHWGLRNAIRQEMDRSAGGYDFDLSGSCEHCEMEFEVSLPLDPKGFFYPKEDLSKTWLPVVPSRLSGALPPSLAPAGTGNPAKSGP